MTIIQALENALERLQESDGYSEVWDDLSLAVSRLRRKHRQAVEEEL